MRTPQADQSLNDWQIAEIENALAEADRGDFASDQGVGRSVSKGSRTAGAKPKREK